MTHERKPTVMVVAPHPDDEVLLAGAWLAWLGQRNVRTAVLYMSAGEQGGDPVTRRREAEGACGLLGTQLVAWLGAPDGAIGSWCEAGGDAVLGDAVHGWSPEVVVSWGPAGGYGHPDHLSTTQALLRLGLKMPVLGAVFPRALWSRRPGCGGSPRVEHAGPEMRSSAVKEGEWEVYTHDEARARRAAALACHESQRPTSGWPRFLGGAWGQWPRRERFRLLHGELARAHAHDLGLREVEACPSFM